MNCLNGYFHFPYFNSLPEELLKAEGKGIIAAFSPTGLSLNGSDAARAPCLSRSEFRLRR